MGNLKAIKVSDNTVVSHTPASGAGPIKGMPWPISYNTIGQTTSVAYVNSASTASNGISTSCAATLPSVTAGNTNIVVVALRQSGGAAPVSTISDGASTYSREVYMDNAGNARTEIWSAKVAAGASTTVTVNLAAGSEVVCAVAQYSGVGALGRTSTNSGSGTAPTVSVTTQDNNNWVVAGFAHQGATGTLSANQGNLRQVNETTGGSSWVKGALTDNTSATPASVTNSVTATQTGTSWAAAALELRTKSTDTIIFSRNATVHSVDFNGTALSANWTTTPTGAPATVSTPVDDGAGNIYIGGSDGKVHRLLVSDGSDAAQVPATGVAGTMGDPTFNYDLNKIHVGATDGHIYTFATGF
ncbi:MAG: hypothetical protein DMD88_01310 [Candidatus Rokuibacteriota bacterium]|nr:MAG: hypothetical protein DMD88_01310 [Candidatus Rokubacteria bacterium]